MKPTDIIFESAACKIYGVSPSSAPKLRAIVPHTVEQFRGRTVRRYLVSDVISARKKKFES